LFKVDVSFLTFVFFIFYTESVDVKILPYDDVSQFYEEYVVDCDANHVPKHERAGKTTFSAAYTKLHETGKYRILGGKGSFKTCEICNNTYAFCVIQPLQPLHEVSPQRNLYNAALSAEGAL